MQKIPVYVISLARSKQRRESIKIHLEGLNISFVLVDAVDGFQLSAEYIKKITDGPGLFAGEIGCYLSHIKVYEMIAAQKDPVALILEDDVVLDSTIKSFLDNGCNNLDFDYCFLSSYHRNRHGLVFYDARSRVLLSDKIKAYLLSAGPFRTHAYLITRLAAVNRLKIAFPIKKPIDNYDTLPYKPRFRRTIPDLAWLNKMSFVSEVMRPEEKPKYLGQSKFPWLSQYKWFSFLRGFIYFKWLKRYLLVQKKIAQGSLQKGIKWRFLPSYAEILRIKE